MHESKDNGIEQIVYYDKGVGTANLVDKITGGMFGRGLDDNFKDGYRFLAKPWAWQPTSFLIQKENSYGY